METELLLLFFYSFVQHCIELVSWTRICSFHELLLEERSLTKQCKQHCHTKHYVSLNCFTENLLDFLYSQATIMFVCRNSWIQQNRLYHLPPKNDERLFNFFLSFELPVIHTLGHDLTYIQITTNNLQAFPWTQSIFTSTLTTDYPEIENNHEMHSYFDHLRDKHC